MFLVDSCDVFVSKLFGARIKDLGDLRHLARRLDKKKIESRLLSSAGGLRANAELAKDAETNWYVLYGEPLPTAGPPA